MLSFLAISFIALLLSVRDDRFNRVKVYLLDGGIPICGELISRGDNYVKILDDAGKMIDINKDVVKVMVRYSE